MDKKQVSLAVIRRLPRYHRYLEELLSNDINKISSKELSERMGLTASQIRQDFNCFGGFGQQGYGYNVELLYNEISEILGISDIKRAVLVGVGNLGRALANNPDFFRHGLRLVGAFDVNPDIVGKSVGGCPVMHIDAIEPFLERNQADLAILAVPPSVVMAVADRLFELGVRGFWNFSNVDIDIPGATFENVHLADSLMTLHYRKRNNEN